MADRRPDLRLTFLGGASSIGASCTLVEVGDTALLVDCGVRLRGPSPLPDLDRLADVRLDAIVITHAHTDHTSALPLYDERQLERRLAALVPLPWGRPRAIGDVQVALHPAGHFLGEDGRTADLVAT